MLISYILSLFLSIFLNLRLRDGMKAKTLIEHHYKTALRDCPCNNPLFLSFYPTLVGYCLAYGKEPHVWFRMQFSTTPSIYLDKQFFDWLTISSSVALVDSSLRQHRHQCGSPTKFPISYSQKKRKRRKKKSSMTRLDGVHIFFLTSRHCTALYLP